MMDKTNNPAGLVKSTVRSLMYKLASPDMTLFLAEPYFRKKGMRREEAGFDFKKVDRVLVARLDEIGDVVMTTPFLRELRRNLPKAWITLIVNPDTYPLAELCPYVNEVLIYDWKAFRNLGPLQRHWRALRLAYRNFWPRRFDLAIVPRWDVDYYHAGFVAYLSGAPWRVGYSEDVTPVKRQLNTGFNRLFTLRLIDSFPKHDVEHNLDVIRSLGGTVQENYSELWLGQEDELFADQVLRSHGVRLDDLLVAIGPGAGEPTRIWPLANFMEVGEWLKKTHGARIAVIGGPKEEQAGKEFERRLGGDVINMAGRTTLRQTGAVLKRCRLYLGNDAGPMHIAAAVRRPVVEISCHPVHGDPVHWNSPLRFGPWGVPNVVLQPEAAGDPCSNGCTAKEPHCILGVGIDRVKEAVDELLSRPPVS